MCCRSSEHVTLASTLTSPGFCGRKKLSCLRLFDNIIYAKLLVLLLFANMAFTEGVNCLSFHTFLGHFECGNGTVPFLVNCTQCEHTLKKD